MRRRSCISANGGFVAHGHAIDVGDRQRKAGALQQRAEVAQIGERRDARRDAAFDLAFGRGKACRSSVSVSPPSSAARNSPSGFERAADLHQRARQVVDELQRQRRHDEIERGVAERQRLLVGGDKYFARAPHRA